MIFTGNKSPVDPELADLLKRASARFDAMSSEEKRTMMEEQRRSFGRGEAGFGSDADEAAYAKALRDGDTEAVARLEAESQERVRRFEEGYDNGEIG